MEGNLFDIYVKINGQAYSIFTSYDYIKEQLDKRVTKDLDGVEIILEYKNQNGYTHQSSKYYVGEEFQHNGTGKLVPKSKKWPLFTLREEMARSKQEVQAEREFLQQGVARMVKIPKPNSKEESYEPLCKNDKVFKSVEELVRGLSLLKSEAHKIFRNYSLVIFGEEVNRDDGSKTWKLNLHHQPQTPEDNLHELSTYYQIYVGEILTFEEVQTNDPNAFNEREYEYHKQHGHNSIVYSPDREKFWFVDSKSSIVFGSEDEMKRFIEQYIAYCNVARVSGQDLVEPKAIKSAGIPRK